MNPVSKTIYVNTIEELNCPISLDKMTTSVQTKCKHFFDSANISQWISTNHNCPLCRTPLSERDFEVIKVEYRPEEPKPEKPKTVEKTNVAAAAVLPEIPSSALPIPARIALPIVEVARSLDEQRVDARMSSVRRLEVQQAAESPRHRILHNMRNRNRAPVRKTVK